MELEEVVATLINGQTNQIAILYMLHEIRNRTRPFCSSEKRGIQLFRLYWRRVPRIMAQVQRCRVAGT